MLWKLYIYDSSSEEDREQAEARFDEDDGVVPLGVGSKIELLNGFHRLLSQQLRFNRVLVQTHGGPGNIKFNGMSIWDSTLRDDFDKKNFERLFPMYTRWYYDGCNVAGDPFGTQLLEMTGKVFLKIGGGEVFGYTSPGYGITWDIPFIGGHTIHFSGQLRKVIFDPGGKRRPDPPAPKYNPANERMERGFKI